MKKHSALPTYREIWVALLALNTEGLTVGTPSLYCNLINSTVDNVFMNWLPYTPTEWNTGEHLVQDQMTMTTTLG